MKLSPKDERIRSLEAMVAADGEIIAAERELNAKLTAALEDLYRAFGWLPNVETIEKMQAKRKEVALLLTPKDAR